jgi:hypothetical protein
MNRILRIQPSLYDAMSSIKCILFVMLFAMATAGCRATVTPKILPKQPEPGRPLIGGEISGVLDNALVTIHVRTPEGWESHSITRPGNGPWETVVTDASGVDYIVIAQAEGFVSTPISYSIQLIGTTAYVVEDGQVTTTEAINLDFHFTPITTPTPPKQ